ncbi:MAG TPA: RecX family transcriptional regulator [Candidatus Saccharimonadales bacterium]|jgi:regulatory protein
MKITGIKAQVRRAGRFAVFLDGKYSFSLSEAGLLEYKLYVGLELDAPEIKKLKQASSDDKLFGLVLHYVAMRPRSEWEIRSYLQRKQAFPALADIILNKLSKNGFVDDSKFAQSWVESRRLLRPSSKRKLQQELRAKRVSDEAISQALAADETDERETLRQLITKKRPRYPDDVKLMQYLARQGFSYDDIKAALQEEAY